MEPLAHPGAECVSFFLALQAGTAFRKDQTVCLLSHYEPLDSLQQNIDDCYEVMNLQKNVFICRSMQEVLDAASVRLLLLDKNQLEISA